jgi:hypothetical protein
MYPLQMLLKVTNLNERQYIHGTSILHPIVDILFANAIHPITNFEIRLHAQIRHCPYLFVTNNAILERQPHMHATGMFVSGGKQHTFYLLDSDIPCTDILRLDEAAVARRAYRKAETWQIDTNSSDDVYVLE